MTDEDQGVTLEDKQVLQLLGTHRDIVTAFEGEGVTVSTAAVRYWITKGHVPMRHRLTMQVIARKKGLHLDAAWLGAGVIG